MKSLIVIIDMDQPGIRRFVPMTVEFFEAATFETIAEVRALKLEHPMGVFDWTVVDMFAGEMTVIV